MSAKPYCVLIRTNQDIEKLFEYLESLSNPDANIGWLSGFIRTTVAMRRCSGVDLRYGTPKASQLELPLGSVLANVTLDRGDIAESINEEFQIHWNPHIWHLDEFETEPVKYEHSEIEKEYSERFLDVNEDDPKFMSLEEFTHMVRAGNKIKDVEYLDVPDGFDDWCPEATRLICHL